MKTLICGFDDSNHAGDRKGDIITGVFSDNLGDANVVRFKNRRDREFFRNWFASNHEHKDYRFAALHDDELRRVQPNLPLVAPSLIDDYLLNTGIEFDRIQIYFDGILKKWHKEFLRDVYSGRFKGVTIDNFVKRQNIHQCPSIVYIADILAHDIYSLSYGGVINHDKRVMVDEGRLLKMIGGKNE